MEGRTCGLTDGWKDRRAEGRTEGQTDGRTDGIMDDKRTDGRTVRRDRRMDGRIDGWKGRRSEPPIATGTLASFAFTGALHSRPVLYSFARSLARSLAPELKMKRPALVYGSLDAVINV